MGRDTADREWQGWRPRLTAFAQRSPDGPRPTKSCSTPSLPTISRHPKRARQKSCGCRHGEGGYRLSRSRHGRYLATLATVQCIASEEEDRICGLVVCCRKPFIPKYTTYYETVFRASGQHVAYQVHKLRDSAAKLRSTFWRCNLTACSGTVEANRTAGTRQVKLNRSPRIKERLTSFHMSLRSPR